jgi:hypothetical protein
MMRHERTRGRAQRPALRCGEGLACAGFLLLAALCSLGSGCSSMYHRARPKLPPEPRAQLGMRMAEALHADSLALDAGRILRDHLRRGVSGETIQTDLDRLEMCAFELKRRTLAARDVSNSCAQKDQRADEIDRLNRRSNSWLDYVEVARRTSPAAQAKRLEALLGDAVVFAPSLVH